VQVGTVDGRVTLRGTVPSAADKARIFGIAVAATRPEHVDDQILVREPAPPISPFYKHPEYSTQRGPAGCMAGDKAARIFTKRFWLRIVS